MAGSIGNQNAKKLLNKEIKEKVYKSYCDWIAKGKRLDTWRYKDENITLVYKTLKKYLKDEMEFPPIHKDYAFAEGYAYWEEICDKGAINETNVNTAALQMIMRNKYGWDKKQESKEDTEDEIEMPLEERPLETKA